MQGNAKELSFISKLCDRCWDVIIDFMVYSVEELSERIDMILKSTNQYILLVLQGYMQIQRLLKRILQGCWMFVMTKNI